MYLKIFIILLVSDDLHNIILYQSFIYIVGDEIFLNQTQTIYLLFLSLVLFVLLFEPVSQIFFRFNLIKIIY